MEHTCSVNETCIDLAYKLGIPTIRDRVVQGAVNPDEFYVYKPALAQGKSAILRRNLGGKAIVATLDLPTFTDCVARVDGFEKGLAANTLEA